MINTPTMAATIDAALETSEIVLNILAYDELTYKEQHDLIDALLTGAEPKQGEEQ